MFLLLRGRGESEARQGERRAGKRARVPVGQMGQPVKAFSSVAWYSIKAHRGTRAWEERRGRLNTSTEGEARVSLSE